MPQPTILYAEDHATIRLAVKDSLEGRGWTIEACADGTSALERIESAARYDLLLLDNELPGLSGIELTARARMRAHRRETPVVIISASEYESAAMRAGAALFLRKPDDINRIAEHVARLLGLGGAA